MGVKVMSDEDQFYFIPYEEIGFPDREKRVKEHYRSHSVPIPEDFTFKRCEAHIGFEQVCGKPARWVRMYIKHDGLPHEMVVCDNHKTEETWSSVPITVDAERTTEYKAGDVSYYLTVRDNIAGEFTVRVWLNQSDGQFYPLIVDETPSPVVQRLREQHEKM